MNDVREKRIGILGAGSIGLRHAGNLKRLGCRDIFFHDPMPRGRQELLAEWTDRRLYIEEAAFWRRAPEIVFVCSPSGLHITQLEKALENGADVFVEKPLAVDLENVEALIEAFEQSDRIAMSACNMRFHPGPARIKDLIDQGAAGMILNIRLQCSSYLPGWRPWQDYRSSYSASMRDGGAILDCIHELDLALWYGGEAEVVAAAGVTASSLGLNTEGSAEILLSYRSGSIGSVFLSFMQRDYRRTCQIVGTDGTLYWDIENGQVQRYDTNGVMAETSSLSGDDAVNEMYLSEAQHFLSCVATRTSPCSSLREGAAALTLAVSAREKLIGCNS